MHKIFLYIKEFINRLILLFIYPLVYLISLYRPILFVKIRTERIGHLVLNTEVFLRKRQLGLVDDNTLYIFIVTDDISNQQLYKMYKRELNIIGNRFLSKILSRLITYNTKFAYKLTLYNTEYEEFKHGKKTISFTKEEHLKGKKILDNLNIHGWYVCIFARDSSYLQTNGDLDFSYHNYRNCDIDTFEKAAKFIISKGGTVVRIGSEVEKEFSLKHEKVIDYSCSDYQSDFADIYLVGNCKYILSSASGITNVSVCFDIPRAQVNILPIDLGSALKNNIFIPKKLIYNNEYLSYENYFKLFNRKETILKNSRCYKKYNIMIENNSDDEIEALAKEMFERIEGTYSENKEEQQRQDSYQMIHTQSLLFSKVKAPIGKYVLEENRWIIDEN